MIMTSYKYGIFCVTEDEWKYTMDETPPTVCPVNASHTVVSDSVNLVQGPEGQIDTDSVTATSTTSTTSGSYVLMNSMTITPPSGTYLVEFSASGSMSNRNAIGSYAIYNNGSITSHSKRSFRTRNSNDIYAISTKSPVTVNGSQSIEIRYTTTSNTFTVYERSLILTKLS